jgi:hypothetical protein
MGGWSILRFQVSTSRSGAPALRGYETDELPIKAHFSKRLKPSPDPVAPATDKLGEQKQVIVRRYIGSQEGAMETYQSDSAKMAAEGYFPTSQVWAPGEYGCGTFLVALLLCVVLVGILIFIYMLIVKPDVTLTVTYELRAISASSASAASVEEKACPRCAERVKAAALVCRFCGHEFTPASYCL